MAVPSPTLFTKLTLIRPGRLDQPISPVRRNGQTSLRTTCMGNTTSTLHLHYNYLVPAIGWRMSSYLRMFGEAKIQLFELYALC